MAHLAISMALLFFEVSTTRDNIEFMQKSSVDKRLCNELENCFKQKGARIAIVDVENNNPAGICFVESLGFKEAKSYV